MLERQPIEAKEIGIRVSAEGGDLEQDIEWLKAKIIQYYLELTGYNKTKTAKLLRVKRTTLSYQIEKLKKAGILHF